MAEQSALRPLVDGRIDLWFCATDAVGVNAAAGSIRAAALARCEALLSDEELAHSRRLRFPQHQREYILSHALLRTSLSHYARIAPRAWAFLRNDFGKPSLIETAGSEHLRFNLSHTQGLSVCAIGRYCELGVDVEFHGNPGAMLDVADEYFSEREISDLKARPLAEQGDVFFRYWTLKESYIKARGEGLSIPLDGFSFSIESDSAIRLLNADGEADDAWQFLSFLASPQHSVAVAARQRELQVNLFWSTIDAVEALADVDELQQRMHALLPSA